MMVFKKKENEIKEGTENQIKDLHEQISRLQRCCMITSGIVIAMTIVNWIRYVQVISHYQQILQGLQQLLPAFGQLLFELQQLF